jgi:hypothetical protein
MPELTLGTLFVIAGAVIVAATYLWSNDPGRRNRARELLKLLIGR